MTIKCLNPQTQTQENLYNSSTPHRSIHPKVRTVNTQCFYDFGVTCYENKARNFTHMDGPAHVLVYNRSPIAVSLLGLLAKIKV